MAQERIEVTIDRTPDEVFAYISDLERAPDWVPDLLSVRKLTDGPTGLGTKFAEVVKIRGGQSAANLEITEFSPPVAIGHRGEGGPVQFTARFLLTPNGTNRTRVTHEYSVSISGIGKLMAPLVDRALKSNTEAALAELKRILESGA